MPAVKNPDPLLAWVSTGTEPGVAPDEIERVRALLNTDDRFHKVERLAADAPDELRLVRDALRSYLLGGDLAELRRVAQQHPLAVEFEAAGARLEAGDDLVGGILAEVYEAQRSGAWARLKACANPDCQWIYFDASRNRSGRWCSMGECGGVMKARAYRERSRRS
ncbi:CGNR zinc finger domain-containing protein [Cellulomonas edaphi]|uniref:CGNR zinc finger domain-containing protein n=1 Tax=Cellulomonas edaphi TaxID=3053468 RepID=A0ABT7S589_9CELL|nr:CGNR zinc finger domain-containing protein [Cellulomons edaphi]MDM7830792.1 CGNR zinc finger domain-containing protein [Cellulomons edaphi]